MGRGNGDKQMSKLSFEERITSAKSDTCSCGRRIMREWDRAIGLCRVCNPFSDNRKEGRNEELTNPHGDNYPLGYNPNDIR